MKKVLLITDYINPPYDEGIKKTAHNLYLELDETCNLKVICRYGFEKDNIHVINTNPLYFSKKKYELIKNFEPDSLIYLPFQSSTLASYLRLKILTIFSKTDNIIFIALQPKSIKKWQEPIVKFLKPKFALTPSSSLNKFWNKIGVENKLIPLNTDLSIFRPIRKFTSKQYLREKYNLPINAYIVSHMGHLTEGRNLKTLIQLQQSDVQIVIVASSSTPENAKAPASLKKELLNSGIIIIDRYIEKIEEIYQLSDIYIFPVLDNVNSIGLPLSILEARACGIPVISTFFESVQRFLQDDYGGVFYSEPMDFINLINKLKAHSKRDYSKNKVADLNALFISLIYEQLENELIML